LGTQPSTHSTVIACGISRQAIYDENLRAWAYELRYVDPEGDAGPASMSSDDTTSSVILSAFADFGLGRVVGSKKAFIHASVKTVTGEMPLPIPSQRVTLQVRDYEYAIEELVPALHARKREGFALALADFVYTDDVDALLTEVDFVKLDFQRLGEAGLTEHKRILQRFELDVVVSGLETSEQVRFCERLGFKNYQGDFLFKPQVMKRKELPANFVIVSDLFTKLQDPDVSFAAIEEIIKRDAGLSVAVLKFLNSSAYGFRQEVSSVSQAVSLLGLNEFMKWTLLVVLSARFEKPGEILTTALVRARTCENYARQTRATSPATSFMVGLLSVLDAILDQPIADLLEELPVTTEVRGAILEFAGPAGAILEKVVTREQHTLELEQTDQAALTKAWLEAVEWADSSGAHFGK
jgi:EAL and modified HD-GYP domain-containing signal transduction protein